MGSTFCQKGLKVQQARSMPAARTRAIEIAQQDLLQRIGQGGFIQFHPALAERLGFKAALFLGHALYWSRHLARHQPRRNGWFYMTASQWQTATGLTTREQVAVRATLVEERLIAEQVAGRPARLHYRVDAGRLAEWAGLSADLDGAPTVTWDAFAPWLKDSIRFYQPLAAVSGSVASGLYLSYLLGAQLQAVRSYRCDSAGFFQVSQDDVRLALCLGSKTQRNARERLRANGLIVERNMGVRVDLNALQRALTHTHEGESSAPTLQLVEATRAQSDSEPTTAELAGAVRWLSQSADRPASAPSSHAHRQADQLQLALFGRWLVESDVGQNTTKSFARMFGQPGIAAAGAIHLADSVQEAGSLSDAEPCQPNAVLSKLEPAILSKLEGKPAKNANLPCPFVETQLPFCRTHIQELNKVRTTTTTAQAREDDGNPNFHKTAGRRRRISQTEDSIPAPQVENVDHNLGELLTMPECLTKGWHEGVRSTLASAPVEIRQSLLDELEGQMGLQGKTIQNPPGYLYALIRRHHQGTLELALAPAIAARRANRQRAEAAIAQALQPHLSEEAPKSDLSSAEVAQLPSQAAIEARAKLAELRRAYGRQGVGK